jgi:dipeptidyl aminopeptidase/acylaminoacyl peptidase
MLAHGTRLGPYEVLDPLGAGGMGEVYRARDTRLERDVAVKILPSGLARESERLERFVQEARAAGALNHPNLLAVYDVGAHDDTPYIVTELLEGETLRDRLGDGPLTPRRAVDLGIQIASGLAAVHEKGIVHRDLKPENVFVTRDERAKILDFGLAKQGPAGRPGGGTPARAEASAATVTLETEPGVVLGTVGYMAPEQARGLPADHRSDLFALGAILYEMLTGTRAFQRDSAVETMNAILKEDPAEISSSAPEVPLALARIVRHCLEKNPGERFQSARDLAFDLESLSGATDSSVLAAAATERRPATARRRALTVLLAALALAAGGWLLAKTLAPTGASPSFQRLTFRRGYIHAARFAPDGQTIAYSAAWAGRPAEVFSTRPESPESRPLDLPDADIVALSATGEMALLRDRRFVAGLVSSGTLARAPFAGGEPRGVLEEVSDADWSPDGSQLAVARSTQGRFRLEYPIGKVLYETGGWISHPRVSPAGDRIAFIEHGQLGDDAGGVHVVDLDGRAKSLSGGWESAWGLAWSPRREEIWFTAVESRKGSALHAVSLDGVVRPLIAGAGRLAIQDIAADGRALLTQNTAYREIIALPPGESTERNLSWLDWGIPLDLSSDGRVFVFGEQGEGGGPAYSVYLRRTDGSPAIRLGEGYPTGLSPDGAWVISIQPPARDRLVLLPTGVGEPKPLPANGLNNLLASWFPDGRRILLLGNEPDRGARLFVTDSEGAAPRPITPEGVRSFGFGVSPDGRSVTAVGADGVVLLYDVDPSGGAAPRPVPGLAPGEVPLRWGSDGEALYVARRDEIPVRIQRLDLRTGRKEPWRTIAPSDPAGITGIRPILISSDGSSYVYGYLRLLSDLYLVAGLGGSATRR